MRTNYGRVLNMVNWTFGDTKLWIHEQYLTIEMMDYYLKSTVDWLEEKEVFDNRQTFICSFMTIIWVNHHLHARVTTKREIFELLDIPNWEDVEEYSYILPPVYVELGLEHDELLELILRNKIAI